MRDRGLLAESQLEAFKAWAAERGWVEEPTKGDYEVLRLRHPSALHPAIYHQRRRSTLHVTSWGVGYDLARSFIDMRRAERRVREISSQREGA